MNNIFYRYKTAWLFLFIIFISIDVQPVQAADCQIDYLYESDVIVPDCVDPFQVSAEASPFTLLINNTEVSEGDEVVVSDLSTVNIEVDGRPRLGGFDHHLFRHDGDNYIEVDALYGGEESLSYGTYTLVSREFELILMQESWLRMFASLVIPTAYAQAESYTYAVTFALVEGAAEEIDPLLLQYAPILYMHPDEEYFPMDVETFITDSALWDQAGIDEQLVDPETLTPALLTQALQQGVDTSDWYLAYSDPDTAKSISTTSAKAKYGTPDPNNVTVYVHKMEDSYTDGTGELHEYIVLQYWLFYAMNNWQDHGGFNNHEGDWESVFVFLDKETELPEYVAYSAHHNDGDPSLNFIQYDSVRRKWHSDEVVKDDGQVVSFVSLGSHANYPNNGDGGSHTVPYPPPFPDMFDITSEIGHQVQLTATELRYWVSDQYQWSEYEGKWGTGGILPGQDGPQGPSFIDVSGFTRFTEPVAWAGVDTIVEVLIDTPTTVVAFDEQGVVMEFADPLDVGTFFEVAPHDEGVTFGVVPEGVTMLPAFWDIDSSLDNDTFSTEVTFSFLPEMVAVLGGDPADLQVLFYNPDTTTWEVQTSTVNTTDSTVTFTATHFSRYGIGLLPDVVEPEHTIEALLEELKTVI